MKIRKAQLQKVPYMLVVGDREETSETASVRSRDTGNMGAMPITQLIDILAEQLKSGSAGE